MTKYFIISGEASGDLHSAHLIRRLKQREPAAQIVGCGGDLMQHAGCRLLLHYNEMAYMGVVAVLKNLGKIRRNFRLVRQALLDEQPDVLILIDYPSFNLKIAEFAKKHLPKTKVCYYIPPKIWAWKKWRVHKIGKYCDRVLAIFPFEPDFYKRYGYEAEYVGNPIVESVAEYTQQSQAEKWADKPYIALLPGSRRNEIEKCLPIMLEAVKDFVDYQVIVTVAPGQQSALYERIIDKAALPYRPALATGNTYSVVRGASAAVVNSGTATLETALLGCPQVAVYHLAFPHLVAMLRPLVFDIPFFTLVNIIPQKQVIRELLAYEFTAENVNQELRRILTDEEYRAEMLSGYQQLFTILSNRIASANAADAIVRMG